jgi:transposase
LRQLAAELVADLRRLDRRVTAVTHTLPDAVAASDTTLVAVAGVGDVIAAKILAHAGPIHRFRSPAAFASFRGVAPIDVSSGDVVRHRLSRAGDRQLNYALHVMAITKIRHNTQGRTYYQRKRVAGQSHKEALRCPKRRLADVVYPHHAPRPVPLSVSNPLTQRGADHEPVLNSTSPTLWGGAGLRCAGLETWLSWIREALSRVNWG